MLLSMIYISTLCCEAAWCPVLIFQKPGNLPFNATLKLTTYVDMKPMVLFTILKLVNIDKQLSFFMQCIMGVVNWELL